MSVDAASTAASVAVVGPSSSAARRLPVRQLQLPRFEDFRKRVSAERTSGLKRKNPIQPKDVMINIGIMKNRDSILFTVKGKTMSLRVPTTIRKVQLLTMGMDKHGDHDQSFNGLVITQLCIQMAEKFSQFLPNQQNCFNLISTKRRLESLTIA